MAPPPKGTPEYDAYLERQKTRRLRQRATAKTEKTRKAAQPFVNAAIRITTRNMENQQDEVVQRKNVLLRQNKQLMHAKKQLLDANIELEEKLNKAKRGAGHPAR